MLSGIMGAEPDVIGDLADGETLFIGLLTGSVYDKLQEPVIPDMDAWTQTLTQSPVQMSTRGSRHLGLWQAEVQHTAPAPK